jgi:hypothetical protein
MIEGAYHDAGKQYLRARHFPGVVQLKLLWGEALKVCRCCLHRSDKARAGIEFA